jgi:uncharacterized membrane protein
MTALLLVVALVVAVVALVRAGRVRDELQRGLFDLRMEVESLRLSLGRLRREGEPRPASPPVATTSPVSPPVEPAISPAPAAAVPVTPAPRPAAVAPPARPAAPPAGPPPLPMAPPGAAPAATAASTRTAAARPIGDWEERIGGSWLNRIGVALLVIGIAFALGYSMTVMGPAGKAALATAVSLALIATGVLLERRPPYVFYGRGLVGGGWAALYATAYAVHELEATRIIEDPRAGFAVLLLVGAGMIVHSLRYANQGLTALAYALSYAAIVLHSIGPYTLAAATLLGLGTVLHLARRRWHALALGGILATYGCLYLWLLRQGAGEPAAFRMGLWMVAINWLVFLVADFAREPADDAGRANARVVAFCNAAAAGLLAHALWIRLDPHGGFEPLLGLGAAYVVTSAALRLAGRRAVHPIHSLVAALLLALAAHKGLDRTPATWTWLAEAQATVLVGMFLRDRFHRMLGSVLFLLPMGAIVHLQGWGRLHQPDGAFHLERFLLTLAACGCFYLTCARLRGFVTQDEAGRAEEIARRLLSYAAFLLILLALWVQLPLVHVAPAAALLMLLLYEVSAPWRFVDLRVQAYLAAVTACLAAVAWSAPSHALLAGVPARVPALVAVGFSLFVVFLRGRSAQAAFLAEDDALRPLFPWAGTLLVALAIWLECRPAAVGPAWLILALFLAEVGIALGEPHLRRPAYLALVASHVSLLLSNLTATDRAGAVSVRAATLGPAIAATYYLWWRLRSFAAPGGGGDAGDEKVGRLTAYLGAGLAALFVRFEFGLEGAALRWSIAMLALMVAGHLLRDADFRLQAWLLSAAVLIRAVGFDFRTAGPILGIDGPLLITGVAVACYLATGFLLRARARGAGPPGRRTLPLEERLAAIGHDWMWSLAVILPALYFWRTRSGFMLIVAWAIVGLAATGGGFALRARSLRLSGLGLLAIALGMTLFKAFTTFDTVGRIVSFIVLGLVLLLISFGYARYRETLRRAS